ncbi:solute carrier family 13 member 5 [Eurytemora carolleeae]|uniref:solute carrier family 13 member 5 n=1 Tax=Eurytemora carolleeae TaxID=1294199 RepID=UPI000C755BFF|nr:solute carrier family 13 member 5 [Eurytemora carolleeae]|eukprot:XP_023339822.1 solute carrier family 13 member 5-like [Eurytemora affinis]
MKWWVKLVLQVGTPLLFSPFLFTSSTALKCAFVVLVMAVYWTLELAPLPVTSMFPVFMFPFLGILDTNTTSTIYLKGTNMMYMGSLMMALAVEESGLHKRIAIRALLVAGTGTSRIMFGFMLPTAFLSMWISNAAAAAMMLPIMEAVLEHLNLKHKHRTMMLLSVAYAANVGGTGTIIGTPPNMILMEFLQPYVGQPLNFGSWILFAVPQLVLNLVFVWTILQIYFLGSEIRFLLYKQQTPDLGVKNIFLEKYKSLGPMSFHEKSVLSLFSTLVLIWFTRNPGFMPGWAELLQSQNAQGKTITIGSASPTILVVSLLFLIPRNPKENPDAGTLLTWEQVRTRFPWGIILLMGGGFALAEGSKASCLTELVGSQLRPLSVLPAPLVLMALCLITSAVSQIASNSATTSMVLPVVLNMATVLQVNPLYLALGVTLTASNAFMLPVSTPPNAIVFSSGGIRILDMICVGIMLNLSSLVVTLLSLHTHGTLLFNLEQFPAWGNITLSAGTSCIN